MRKQAVDAGKSFNPVVISLSWPAKQEGFSYKNKRNDADEVGLTVANLIVNDVLGVDEHMVLGEPGFKRAQKLHKRGTVGNLQFFELPPTCDSRLSSLSHEGKPGSILYLDATDCIGDHGDVRAPRHGKLMWRAMEWAGVD